MTTRREYDVLSRLRRVESLSTAMGASKVSFDSPGAHGQDDGERVAEFEGRLELHCLPPQSPKLNPDELAWHVLRPKRVGRKPVESAEELHERATVHMETLEGPPRKVRSFFKATHTKYAAI